MLLMMNRPSEDKPTTTTNISSATTSPSVLLCHCDHCSNNTCAINDQGQCYAQLALDKNGEWERKTNCFKHSDLPLMQNLICGSNITSSSNVITRCCNSGNYCNQADDFLPPIPPPIPEPLPWPSHIYHDLSPEWKICLLLAGGIMVMLVIALAQRKYLRPTKSKRHIYYPTNSMSNNSNLIHKNQHHRPHQNHHQDHEDYSETSSGKGVNSDVTIYDTNSMASREPLIAGSGGGGGSSYQPNGPGGNLLTANGLPAATNTTINQLKNHPNPMKGPWMSAEDAPTSKNQSTFAISFGSGAEPVSGTTRTNETSSGSGRGQPYLTQRSIAHDIELVEVVGRGYFGVVWRGKYKGEPVAVKIFSSKAEPSWEREAEIYQTTLLRHKNILGFIATDRRDDVSMTGYWLVTEYYPMGSLNDFLKANSVSMPDAVRMAFSIANGLAHLHTEIFGTQGKPAIAHRDIKSKNILVKNDGTCCIGDLGMAVRYNSATGIVDVPTNSRVGTRRYLAPELLENKLNLTDFEGVKATDVYSLGLVLWEVLRRTCYKNPINQHLSSSIGEEVGINELAILCDLYEVPYQDLVPLDPTSEDMRQCVCVSKLRPRMSYRWSKFAPMRDFSTLIRECWYEKPQARLSALRVRKTLGDIDRHYFNLNMEYD